MILQYMVLKKNTLKTKKLIGFQRLINLRFKEMKFFIKFNKLCNWIISIFIFDCWSSIRIHFYLKPYIKVNHLISILR